MIFLHILLLFGHIYLFKYQLIGAQTTQQQTCMVTFQTVESEYGLIFQLKLCFHKGFRFWSHLRLAEVGFHLRLRLRGGGAKSEILCENSFS